MLFALFLLVRLAAAQSHPRTWSWLFFLFLVKCNIALSAKTVFGDPGLVPPVYRYEQDDGSGIQKPNHIVQRADTEYLEDMFALAYCRTCKHLRPKECAHCKVCDVCVRGFDHHCVVLGCCIGERNVGTFIGYLFSVAISSLYGALLVIRIAGEREVLSATALDTLTVGFLLLCGFGTAILVGGFACYYTLLVFKKKTSKSFLSASTGVVSNFHTSSASAGKSLWQHIAKIMAPGASYIPLWLQENPSDDVEREELQNEA